AVGIRLGRVSKAEAVVDIIANPVAIHIPVIGVRASVTGVARAVPVGVLLAGIRDLHAVVAGIADVVPVLVRLFRVRHVGTVVGQEPGISEPVPIGVGACVLGVGAAVAVVIAGRAYLGDQHDLLALVQELPFGMHCRRLAVGHRDGEVVGAAPAQRRQPEG